MSEITAIQEYIESLRLGPALLTPFTSIQLKVEKVCPEPIEIGFITDQIGPDGHPQYLNAWFFSKQYVMEVPGFYNRSNFDIVKYAGNISRIEISAQDFNLNEEANENSRLSVMAYMSFARPIAMSFTATGRNCLALDAILRSNLIPSIK